MLVIEKLIAIYTWQLLSLFSNVIRYMNEGIPFRWKNDRLMPSFVFYLQSYTRESATFSRRRGISEERSNDSCECWRWWSRVIETWRRCGWKRRTFHGRLCSGSTASFATSSSTTDASSSAPALACGATLWCTGSSTPTGSATFATTTAATGTPTGARHHHSLWCSGKSRPYCFPSLIPRDEVGEKNFFLSVEYAF